MKKSELKKIIRECLKETILKSQKSLNEARRVSYFGLKHGELEQYALRKLQNDEELPPRIDYYPHYSPKTTIKGLHKGQDPRVDPSHEKQVERLALDDLETIKVDGVPLTQLYNWKLYSGNFNAHGWGVPDYKYYVVGSRKV